MIHRKNNMENEFYGNFIDIEKNFTSYDYPDNLYLMKQKYNLCFCHKKIKKYGFYKNRNNYNYIHNYNYNYCKTLQTIPEHKPFISNKTQTKYNSGIYILTTTLFTFIIINCLFIINVVNY